MGNFTGTVLHKNVRPYGRSNLVRLTGSGSYATGGDTVPIAVLGIGKKLSALLGMGHTTPSGYQTEIIPGATEFAAPLVRLRTPAGVEVANATSLVGETMIVEAFAS